ncbi:MAG: DUF2281 domain-containing protein [Chloroflexota bacterium]|nr:DUF2281 domain-containing protein [Chloroflexota bacterium]
MLVANANDRAFTEFVNRYAMYVVALASRVLGASPPADLPIAVFSRLRTLANEGPKEPASVKDWVLNLAFAVSLEYQKGIHHNRTPIRDEERQNLAKQIADNSDLFRQIEEYLAYQTREAAPPKGRIGIARGRYTMTSAFDDPLPEFEAYE